MMAVGPDSDWAFEGRYGDVRGGDSPNEGFQRPEFVR